MESLKDFSRKETDCIFLEGCPFFNNLTVSVTEKALKALYCKRRYTMCERYKLRMAGSLVDKKMWPNGKIV